MAGRIIDSKRHAAFQLGYLGRRLSIHHDSQGFKEDPDEIDDLVGGLDGPAFVLLADDPANYRCYKEQLSRIAGLHAMQVDQFDRGMSLATIPGAPEPTWLLLGQALERLGVLGRRALRGDGRLEAWFAVGGELAELTLLAIARSKDAIREEPAWDEFFEALAMLPDMDRWTVEDLIPISWGSQGMLTWCLKDAYESILDCAAEPERVSSVVGGRAIEQHGVTGGEEVDHHGDRHLRGSGQPRTECQSDIIATLAAEGRRMTTTVLLGEMSLAGREYGESTVRNALSEMRRVGLLDNCDRCRPRGYGLPVWSHCH